MRDATDIRDVVNFWIKYGYYDVGVEKLEDYIRQHILFNTLLVEKSGEEIVGICRFNLIDDVCVCLDVVIRPDFQQKGLLKSFLRKGMEMYPHINKLRFERGLKKQEYREYDIRKFLGKRRVNEFTCKV